MSYLTLIVVTLALGLGAQWWVNHRIKKYSRVSTQSGLTGYQVATGMLQYYGINNVVVRQGGHGDDFFNPKDNSVTLGPDSFRGCSITALATACHEVGHACQYAQNYMPMRIRTAMVPAVNLASNAWIFILLIGVFLNLVGLVNLAIALYAIAVLFGIVTLPVEFDASNRALRYMEAVNLPSAERVGSKKVLTACAFTYVASALASLLQLVYLLGAREE